MKQTMSDKRVIAAFLVLPLAFLILVVFYPIFQTFRYSLLDWNGYGEGTFIGFENYIKLFQDPVFLKGMLNSFIFALAAILIEIPVGLILALALARGIKAERVFITLYFIPVLISAVIIAQIWMRIYNPDYGALNYLLRALGLESLTRNWLSDQNTALAATIVPAIWQYFGYHMIILFAGLKSISPDIYDAAKVDGANWFNTSLRISIPLLKPVLRFCVIMAVTGSLKVFDIVFVMTGGGPIHSTEVVGTYLINRLFRSNMFGYGSTIAVFVIIECFIFAFVIKKIFDEKEEL